MDKNYFKYLGQESYCKVLDLVKQKEFYPNEYMSDFLKVWNKFDARTMKYYHDLYLKFDFFVLADVFKTFRNISLKIYGLCQSHFFSAPALS